MFSFRRFFFDAFLPAFCVIGIAYNFLIALNGEEGVRAHKLVRENLTEKQQELRELEEHREWLSRKADMLSVKTLDDDMLDESARRVLGYAADGEYVMPAAEFDQLIKRLEQQTR